MNNSQEQNKPIEKPKLDVEKDGSWKICQWSDGWNTCCNRWQAYHTQEVKALESKLYDLEKLSDEQEEKLLEAKIKALEAEIAKEKEISAEACSSFGELYKLRADNKALKAQHKDVVSKWVDDGNELYSTKQKNNALMELLSDAEAEIRSHGTCRCGVGKGRCNRCIWLHEHKSLKEKKNGT